ncbi:uncharacterized protein KD926_007130 [Aspergillus affinis]|uniref:uncharacterized protein n=1 Tax=Aspergillus affinis TaxID=1070780 RepID=UPI0022FDB521|nr:uncharacterized protein KD926_007130 [Aspergillus affinis]KAI9045827.1 hypothetical protein KD926_007130 [Aspergillus affinis]
MPPPKRSHCPFSSSTWEKPPKMACTRDQDPSWTKQALETISVKKQPKMNKLLDMKKRIEQAEKELAMLNDKSDQNFRSACL